MSLQWARALFVIAGLYDCLLGLTFLFFGMKIFEFFRVTPPNHIGYIQFPSILLITFAALFFQIATNPRRNRGLIAYGIALKCAYAGLVFWYRVTTGVPGMWIPWAWADLVFLILFVIAWQRIGTSGKIPAGS